jgi:hypothetical protein
MILFSNTIKIEKAIKEEFLEWLLKRHIPEIMATRLFSGQRLLQLLEPDDHEGYTYSLQLYCDSHEKLAEYRTEYEQSLPSKIPENLKNKFVIFRTVLEEVAFVGSQISV